MEQHTSLGVTLHVNGGIHHLSIARDTALLYALRNDLVLNGPKFGCGLGECGSCTVLVGDVPARSCSIPVSAVEGREVTTLEGLAIGGQPGRVQAAFIAEQACQCGYCLNGMIVAAEGLLRRTPAPTEGQIRGALSHNLCRCGTHIEILRAVRRAAGR